MAISKSKEEVKKLPAHTGSPCSPVLWRDVNLALCKMGQQNLPPSGCIAACLITDMHGGFGALWVGIPCANANVTALSTTQGPRQLVLFYCFSSIIMLNSCCFIKVSVTQGLASSS